MKRFVLTILFTITFTGLWASTKPVLNKLVQEAEVSNGDSWVEKYDTKNFNLRNAIEDYRVGTYHINHDQSCQFENVIGRRASLQKIGDQSYGADYRTEKVLRKLYKERKLRTILARVWDQASGDSEYCSIYEFAVYTKDGYVLHLSYEHTD